MIDVFLAGGAVVDASTVKSPEPALPVAIRLQKLEVASALISGGASLKAASRF